MRQATRNCSHSDDPRASRSYLASARSAAVFMNRHISGIGSMKYVAWSSAPNAVRTTQGCSMLAVTPEAAGGARQIVSEHHLGQLGGAVRVLPWARTIQLGYSIARGDAHL